MFEALKKLFCIHRYVVVQNCLHREGRIVELICEKCGRGKHTLITNK